MFSRVCLFLIGAVYIYYQVNAAEEIFIGDLVVESNFTLTQQQLSLSNVDVHVNISNLTTVTIVQTELVSECISTGADSSCNCSGGYSWSNDVCYGFGCCNNTACTQNVSHITPLCIPKVQVYLNGSVTLNVPWDNTKIAELETAFRSKVNGVESLKITDHSQSNRTDFEAVISVKLNTSVLQNLVTELEGRLSAKVWIHTVGMVTITSPEDSVRQDSNATLNCTIEEAPTSSAWHFTRNHSRLELSNGSVVTLSKCKTVGGKSCFEVFLQRVTGAWSGTYECGLTIGAVTHTAKAQLSVALLPEVITMKIDPPVVDCAVNSSVKVTATIQTSTESFTVSWMHTGMALIQKKTTTSEDNLVYSVKLSVSCQKTTEAQSVSVTFKNSKGHNKTERVDIPVIYKGSKVCDKEEEKDVLWPKTPDGSTVINQTCGEGKVGNKSRTCKGNTWKSVISNCISQELKKVENEAEMFEKGLGATPEAALNIFEGLKNTTVASESDDNIAQVRASVNVLNVMAKASKFTTLMEPVLTDFLEAASNMLNGSWHESNTSIVQDLSSGYLKSVEGLVKNIQVNKTSHISKPNLDFKVCSEAECNLSMFNVSVALNNTSKLKTVAVKNLVDKLNYPIQQTLLPPNSILIIATLENSSMSSFNITMEFPYKHLNQTPVCVYWNHTKWSQEGCTFEPSDGNNTICKCSHLSAFSVLMSKNNTPNPALDIITYVGLSVSICCLLILLIIESLVWSAVVKTNLSHFRHTALVNIATFLLLGNCSFLASASPEILSDDWCLILTICKHLFFLAMFGWMLCMSIMLVHQLIFVFSPLRKRVFMLFSSIVGYACPTLIVAISYLYCKYTNKNYHDKETCWLVFEKVLEGSMHAFLLPVGTIIFINLFSMMVVILTLMKSSVPDGSKADDKETAKSIIKVMVFLTPVFGVTWGIGFLQLMLTEGQLGHTIARYSFTILNAFQGFFVMLTGCFAERKVREELLNRMFKGKHDSLKNSTTFTKDK
ncbi:adhesion G protein-coupled receptor F4 [Paralichthys olivaceus]|uniref:adhesion G protein-coupled receptor F4 n=1 Tax=Paralichthys olivaceus TaxID=8255 RepID=UPI0037527526